MTGKLKNKMGIAFKSCPYFKFLRDSDLPANQNKCGTSGSCSNRLTFEDFNKGVDKIDKHDEKIEKKKKKAASIKWRNSENNTKKNIKKIPRPKDIRSHLEKIIKYHGKTVNDSIPSIYPLLGPVNSEDEEEDGGDESESDNENSGNTKCRSRDKMMHTKKELKIYS